jgi:microcompartment protein CcmL/EutN
VSELLGLLQTYNFTEIIKYCDGKVKAADSDVELTST